MSKQSAIDKAIENLKYQRKVLDLSIAQLEAQRDQKPPAKPRRLRPVPGAGVAS